MDDLMSPDAFVAAIRDRGERTPDTAIGAKGALGSMQVLPATAGSPGFGISPATATTVEEYNRVGQELAKGLLNHYGHPALAAAAYNAGPGRVAEWIKQYGDPRDGTISVPDWVGKIPFPGTQGYVQRVLGQGPEGGAKPVDGLQVVNAGAPGVQTNPLFMASLLAAQKTNALLAPSGPVPQASWPPQNLLGLLGQAPTGRNDLTQGIRGSLAKQALRMMFPKGLPAGIDLIPIEGDPFGFGGKNE